MCGIAFLSNLAQRYDESVIKKMTRSLHHRGPDASGIESTKHFYLGHTRLQILDPVGGIQPMWDASKRYCLVFNGEIFNFQQLRQDLEKDGHQFRTRSDTEVVLQSFLRWGEKCVDHLNGQFAFAVLDTQQQTVFAARDRMGENPLFWAQTNTGDLIIASELKAILASELLEPKLDLQALDCFLKLVYISPHQTIYQNIHSLPPGCTLHFKQQKVDIKTYWQPKLATRSIDSSEAASEIRRLLTQSVKRQMVADTDVGAFLSGGLDSTTIVGLMSQNNAGSKIKTFAVGFGDLIDELPYANAVADHYTTDHSEIQMDIDVPLMLDKMVDVYDQPFGDSSNIPTFLVSQFASKHVKVVLSGDGGDELFGGYGWYHHLLEQANLSRRKDELFTSWALSKVGFGSLRKRNKIRFREMKQRLAPNSLFHDHLARLSVQSETHRQTLFANNESFQSADVLLKDVYSPSKNYDQQDELIDQATEFDLRCYLPGDIFAKVDRASMANGLETRSPFMDVELVEFVLSLPAKLRFSSEQMGKRTWSANKWLLRKSCQDLWPKAVTDRPKQGFGAPIKQWLQIPEVNDKLNRVIAKDSPLKHLFPNISLSEISANNPEQARWNILCLGLWLEKHSQCLNHLK